MIVSASYKTDIPTFYGEWFIRRLRAGHCKMVNPYNRRAIRVELDRKHVDGFVFWTKNAAPFLKALDEVRERSFPFVVQYTINGYPRALETSVVDARKSIETARRLRDTFGPLAVVWRYDTIIASDLTPLTFHVENFGRLARSLEGVTTEVVISFVQAYKKTKRNLDDSAHENGFRWWDPRPEEKRSLASTLVDVARSHGMQLAVCSQRDYIVNGAADAHCVDAHRFAALTGRDFRVKLKGNRPECGCFESRDIGEYDTCPHGCTYCYSVQNRPLALERFRRHDPDSEFLFDPGYAAADATDTPRTLPLFDEEK
jgi:hypothetical protein